MRLAIVSDIHGNLTALDAVIADLAARRVEQVVQGGDLALIGCQPAEVIDRVRELQWPGVVGNTDELLWRPQEHDRQLQRASRLASLLELLFDRYAPVTRELIGPRRISWLRSLPAEHRRSGLVLIHASPGELWRAPAPDSDERTLLSAYAPLQAPTVVYGHIHRPFVRCLDGLTVANSGSVGSPFDGDPRASYLLLDDDQITVIRVQYDIEREVALLLASGYPDAERIAAMRRQGRFVPPAG